MNKFPPPEFILRFFRWFCHPELHPFIEGDLMELYKERVKASGRRKANFKFALEVLLLFRPGIIRSFNRTQPLNHTAMFRNYFKIGWRNLLKHKGYSLINIGGLAVGMAVAVLIGLWVWDELSFNQYHENYDRIAQVKYHQESPRWGTSTQMWHVSGLGNLLRSSYSNHFEKVVMARQLDEHIISFEDKSFLQPGNFMSPEGPDMLTLKMIQGTREGLEDRNSILLSKTLADKLFGNQDPIDQLVSMDASSIVKVTGVYEDLSRNSSFWGTSYIAHIDLYFSIAAYDPNAWFDNRLLIYIQLPPYADFAETSTLIQHALLPHIDPQWAEYNPTLFLHPMSQWHLYSTFENGINVTSERLQFVWLYSTIGFFVLLLACINFMNLSTARAEKRAREIGIRKSIGSTRYQLISQFLSESLLVSLLAFCCSLLLIRAILPWFNEIAGKEIILPLGLLWFWVIGLGFTLLTGVLAGSYPALYLSSFNPIKSLKGTFRIGKYAALPRKMLVIFQFTVSITLIIGTIIVHRQVQHAKDRPIGFSRDHLLMIPKRTDGLYGKCTILSEELKKTGAVVEVAEANYPLTNENGTFGNFDWPGKEQGITFNAIKVNYDYGKTVGWELLEGRDFSRDFRTDVSGVIITESARVAMGLENPIGETIHHKSDFFGRHDFTIIGVVKDLVKKSPFQAPKPGMMFLSEEEQLWMFLRLNPQMSASKAIPKIEEVFKKVAPSTPFDYTFVDEAYDAKFHAEERIGKLATFFTILTILISSLGVFGLATFTAKQRTQEIGIRKVLGASVIHLWRILSTDFVMLIIISTLIAVPIANYFLNSWLQNYEYRTVLSWWIFAAAGLGALVITLLTVSYQTVNAALANPVNSLRNE